MSQEECTDLLAWYQQVVLDQHNQIKNLEQEVRTLADLLKKQPSYKPANPHLHCDWNCECRDRVPG